MRISDWSSDVCSSDLGMLAGPAGLDRPRGLAETRCGRWLDHAVMLDEGPAGLVVVIMGRFVHRQDRREAGRSEEHTSELQSLMRTSYAVFCLKKKKHITTTHHTLHKSRH